MKAACGGAGRAGHYAIQWVHHAGARVISTASNYEDGQACLEAGADAIVNHREEDWWLDEIAKAHELIENCGFRGCVVTRS